MLEDNNEREGSDDFDENGDEFNIFDMNSLSDNGSIGSSNSNRNRKQRRQQRHAPPQLPTSYPNSIPRDPAYRALRAEADRGFKTLKMLGKPLTRPNHVHISTIHIVIERPLNCVGEPAYYLPKSSPIMIRPHASHHIDMNTDIHMDTMNSEVDLGDMNEDQMAELENSHSLTIIRGVIRSAYSERLLDLTLAGRGLNDRNITDLMTAFADCG
jgi:hypothetical protein